MKFQVEIELTDREIELLKLISERSVIYSETGIANIQSTPVTSQMLDQGFGLELSSLETKDIIRKYPKSIEMIRIYTYDWIDWRVGPSDFGMNVIRVIAPNKKQRSGVDPDRCSHRIEHN